MRKSVEAEKKSEVVQITVVVMHCTVLFVNAAYMGRRGHIDHQTSQACQHSIRESTEGPLDTPPIRCRLIGFVCSNLPM